MTSSLMNNFDFRRKKAVSALSHRDYDRKVDYKVIEKVAEKIRNLNKS